MRPTSTDQTAIIVRVPHQPEPEEGTGPASWTPTAEDVPAEPEPLTNPRLTVLAWLVPALGATGVGVWRLGNPGLSEDELDTWGLVTAGWSDFRSVIANVDGAVTPYYVMMRGWTTVAGDSDFALRAPSVLFAAVAAAVVAAIGIKLGGRLVGLLAGLLCAVLPGVTRYAQDARPYALVMLCAALSTYLLLRVLDSRRAWTWVAYASVLLVLGLANALALFLVLAHGVLVIRQTRSGRTFGAWLGAVAVALAPVAVMLYLGRWQTDGAIGWIPELSWARFAETPERLFGATLIAGAVLALALAALSMRPPAQALTLWALVPLAGMAVVSLVMPLWVPRYLLFVLPAWVLLAAMALRKLTVLRGLVAVLLLAGLSVPTHLALREGGGHELASRDISLVIRANQLPGDTVMFGPFANSDQRTSRDAFLRYLDTGRRPEDKLMVQAPRVRGSLGAQECPDAEVPACFGKPERVWVVRKGALEDNILENIGVAKEQLLRVDFVQSEVWRLKGFTVALFTRKPAAPARDE